MLKRIFLITSALLLTTACSKATYSNLPRSKTFIPPWYSNFPELPNSYGFKNLGTAVSPSILFLSDNNLTDGDIISVSLNGNMVYQNLRIVTPDVSPPHSISLALNRGKNQIDVFCVSGPGIGCTLQAEIAHTTAGSGLVTINKSPIPEGQHASFLVEYKPS